MNRLPQALALMLAPVICMPGRADTPSKTPDLQASKAFALQVAKLVRANDIDKLSSLLDADALLDRALRDISASKQAVEGFRTGFKGKGGVGMTLWRGVCRLTAKDGSYTLLRVRLVDGKKRALFRLLSNGGLNYHDLLLDADAGGKLRIVDVYAAMSGEFMSQTTRRMFLLALGKEGKREGEINLNNDIVTHAAAIQRFFSLGNAGRYREALKEWDNLPPSIRKDKAALVLHVNCAFALSKEDAKGYEKAMDEFRQAFPNDPAVDLVTLDSFFLRKKYKEFHECVRRIERAYGPDAYLDVLRAIGYLEEGKTDEAKKCARGAIKAEPDLTQAYWTLVTISLRGREFKDTAQLLDDIAQRFHVQIGDLTAIEAYREFTKSPEYKEWMAARKKK